MSKILISILCIAILFLGWALGMAFPIDELKFYSEDYSEAIGNCSGLDTKPTAYCLRDYVETFYNYSESIDVDRKLEDIKANGGDCHDYSELYKEMAEELNFTAYTFKIYPRGENWGHKFAIITKNRSYCLIDQLSVDCFKFL